MDRYHEEPLAPWNFNWIVKGELAIMGHPKSEGNVRYILDQGITHLVSLSPEKQPPFEYFPNHFRWTPIDVLEFEPPTLQQILTFIKICRQCYDLKEPCGVHCRMGRGRSGVMAACFLVYFYDMPPQKAIMQVRMISPGSIETYAQEKAVQGYFDYIRQFRPPSPDVDTIKSEIEIEIKPYVSVLHRYYPELR